MTLLVWDGKHLAADSRVTRSCGDDEFTTDFYTKIHAFRNADLVIDGEHIAWIAICGKLHACELAMH